MQLGSLVIKRHCELIFTLRVLYFYYSHDSFTLTRFANEIYSRHYRIKCHKGKNSLTSQTEKKTKLFL